MMRATLLDEARQPCRWSLPAMSLASIHPSPRIASRIARLKPNLVMLSPPGQAHHHLTLVEEELQSLSPLGFAPFSKRSGQGEEPLLKPVEVADPPPTVDVRVSHPQAAQGLTAVLASNNLLHLLLLLLLLEPTASEAATRLAVTPLPQHPCHFQVIAGIETVIESPVGGASLAVIVGAGSSSPHHLVATYLILSALPRKTISSSSFSHVLAPYGATPSSYINISLNMHKIAHPKLYTSSHRIFEKVRK